MALSFQKRFFRSSSFSSSFFVLSPSLTMPTKSVCVCLCRPPPACHSWRWWFLFSLAQEEASPILEFGTVPHNVPLGRFFEPREHLRVGAKKLRWVGKGRGGWGKGRIFTKMGTKRKRRRNWQTKRDDHRHHHNWLRL